MKKALILQNVKNEGPGLIADLLEEAGLKYEIIHRDQNEKIPPLTHTASSSTSNSHQKCWKIGPQTTPGFRK